MPGGIVFSISDKKERDKYAKQMQEVVRTLDKMNKQVGKLVDLTQTLVKTMVGK
jgi:hypothetical protein